MAGPKFPAPGTMRIADQVIEEVDEQMTVTSNRGHEPRPTAQSLFAPSNEKLPARSQPIDVPGSHRSNIEYERVQSVMQQEHQPYLFPSDTIFSSSAPDEVSIPLPKISVEKSVEFKEVTPSGSNDKLGRKSCEILRFLKDFSILNSKLFSPQLKKTSTVQQPMALPRTMISSNSVWLAKKSDSRNRSKKLHAP